MKKRLFTTLFALLLFISVLPGCKLFEPSLSPTVAILMDTIKDMREQDYEKGRVTFSTKNKKLNAKLLAAKIERLKEAENNAAIALEEKPPHVLGDTPAPKKEKGKK
jgi:hypothetical protein